MLAKKFFHPVRGFKTRCRYVFALLSGGYSTDVVADSNFAVYQNYPLGDMPGMSTYGMFYLTHIT